MGVDEATGVDAHAASGGDSAVVFPGMGPVRFEDVAKFLMIDPRAREMVATADDVLGYPLLDRYQGTEGDYSEYAQVTFLVTCLAMASWAESARDLRPVLCTGPSFGGKAAAVYSGAISLADGVRLTAEISRCEQDYFAHEHTDVVTHSFARTPRAVLDGLLAELDELGEPYEVSCRIDEDFHMLSLRDGRVDWLQERLRAAGGLPLYSMRPPMHAAMFAPLRDRVEREILAGYRFADPRIPVVADQDGAVLVTGEDVRRLLLDGFVRPVCWPDVVDTLRGRGVGRVYVAGPDAMFGRVPLTTRTFDTVGLTPRLALQPRPAASYAR